MSEIIKIEDFDKNKRRKRILIRNTVFVLIAYAVTQLTSAAAKFLGLSSISWDDIALVSILSAGITLIYIVIISFSRKISTGYANIIFFSQYGVWLVLYTLWVYRLHEVRIVALFFALLALAFLLSYSNFIQSVSIAVGVSIIQASVSYYAIVHGAQSGSLKAELFFTLCFIPSALFIAYLAYQYSRQRGEIKQAKRTAEKALAALWSEMELAKRIQNALLPVKPVILDFEIAAYMKPADQIGGDYYDVINVKGYNWIVIGDVSGHGVPAGLVMMMAQTAIHTLLLKEPGMSPSSLLTAVNKAISNNIRKLGESMYMTITVFASFAEGKFFYSGLHEDFLVYRGLTGSIESIETSGMWIGIIDDIGKMVTDNSISLASGDCILLYTDGVTEAWGAGMKKRGGAQNSAMFGKKRLAEILRENGNRSPEEIKARIIEELTHFKSDDDITLLIMKRKF